jgi:hypothetical protein
MNKREKLEWEMNLEVAHLIDCARVVVILNGADKLSMEQLADSLYRLGKMKWQYQDLEDDENDSE